MQNARASFYIAALLALVASLPFVRVSSGQEAGDFDTMEETSFLNRTPEEYRRAILKAPNEAQIDAFICQMIVQEMRQNGVDHPDDQFLVVLESPEMKIERQERLAYWLKEREKEKAKANSIDYRKYGIGIGMALIVLIVVMFVGSKRRPKIETTERIEATEEMKTPEENR